VDPRPPLSGPPSPGSPEQDRLDTWKEIAAYLRRDVRTAQRWEETEDLPVHRHPNAKRGAVFGFKSEIDEWWKHRHPLFQRRELEPKIHTRQSPTFKRLPARVQPFVYVAVSLTVILVFGAAKLLFPPRLKHLSGSPARTFSIGISPIEDLSNNPDDRFLAEGITSDICSHLGQMSAFQVSSVNSPENSNHRGSSSPQSVQQQRLDGLMEGSLSRSGNVIQLAVRIVEPLSGRKLWDDHLESNSRAVLSLQDDIAAHVAQGIAASIVPGDPPPVSISHTVDPMARLSYLKGEYYSHFGDPALLEDAVGYFSRALEQDPSYAPAYSRLADAYSILSSWDLMPARKALATAKLAALRAVKLDPALAQAHASLGHVTERYDWDFPAAERELRAAIDLDPNYARAHQWRGDLLVTLGQFDQGLSEMNKALSMRPASLRIRLDLAEALFLMRKPDAAIRQLRTELDANPKCIPALRDLGDIMAYTMDYTQARNAYVKLATLTGNKSSLAELAVLLKAARGDQSAARTSLRELLRRSRGDGDAEFRAAIVSAEMNYKEGALQALERAYADRSPDLVYLKVHPALASLHPEPRFQSLEKRIGLLP
jgi:TolB-like protein/tetratricopeptide (TPR) repeat protein